MTWRDWPPARGGAFFFDYVHQEEHKTMLRVIRMIFFTAVVVAALWLSATFAAGVDAKPATQSVPTLENGSWVLPERSASNRAVPFAASGYGGGVEQWRDPVEAACGYDASCTNWMLSTISCESGGDHGAVGYYGEVGILQFRPDGLWGAVSDPYTQISIAADAYYSGLRHHWVCSPW